MNPPTATALLHATQALARELSLDLPEESIGGRFLQTLQELLPGRALCLRVVDGQRHEVTSLFFTVPGGGVEGSLLSDPTKVPLYLKRATLKQTGLLPDIAASARVQLTDHYMPLFSETLAGFAVPLVAGGELLGLVNCEYPTGAADRAEGLRKRDEGAIVPLCNQLSVALRNLRLLHRARSYEGYLRRMSDAMSALVVVIDRKGRLTIVNRPMESVTGYAPGDHIDELRERQGDGEGEPQLLQLLQAALSGQDSEGIEVLLCRPAGPPTRAVFNVAALRDATGAIDGAAAMGQDLERVRSLERQVLQAERLATLGQLAAGVVHELNNPLSSIVSYGGFLARRLGAAGGEYKQDAERAQRICESAERLQRLTRDLMSYGRPTAEPARVEPLSLTQVVEQALSFCEHVLSQAGARLHTVLPADLPQVMGERTQLQQVVVNLVTNACHALCGERGRDQVTLRAGTALLNGAQAVLLSVCDTGTGIPEPLRARVFEPFFSTKGPQEGTGLGLPIVKNIVDAHGGQISFETTMGRGTCFTVLLPAARAQGCST